MNNHLDNNITPAALLEQLVYVDTFMPEIDDPSQLDERLTAELSAFADDSFVFPDEDKPKQENQRDDDDLRQQSENLLNRFNDINNSFSNNHHSSVSNTNTNSATIFSTPQQSNFNTSISSILSPLSSLNNNSSSSSTITTTSNERLTANQKHPSLNQNLVNTNDLLTTLPKVPVPPGAQFSLISAGLSQTQIDALAALIAQHQGSDTQGPTAPNNIPAVKALNNGFIGRPNIKVEPTDNGLNNITGSVDPSVTTNSSLSGSIPSESIIQERRSSVKIESTGDADLDKRKRNTAASARFRIKKKLKEQQLERSVRELNELTITLEKKIQTLEMENKLLRNLVVEKSEQRSNEELEKLRLRAKTNLDNNHSFGFSSNSNRPANSGL